MSVHIFKQFLSSNFIDGSFIDFRNHITLLFGSPGSGKTFFLNKFLNHSERKILYIGRDFEADVYFQEFISVSLSSIFNKQKMFLSSSEKTIDISLLEDKINELLKLNYIVVFDEVFWSNQKEYFEMIERLIYNNKYYSSIVLVLNDISDKESFSYQRIAKNLDRVVLFKNDIIPFSNIPGENKIFKRDTSTFLTNDIISEFHKN